MTQETLIEKMKKYKEIKAKIKLNKIEISKIENIIEKINKKYDVKITPTYTEGCKSSNVISQQEKNLIKKEDEIKNEEDKINQRIEENKNLQLLLDEIDVRLEILPDDYREIVYLRYIDLKKVDYIERVKNISYVSVYRICKKSLKKMVKI